MAYQGRDQVPLPELESVRRLRESVEGGPGSGPHKASGRSIKAIQHDLGRALDAHDKHRETKPNNHPDVVAASKKADRFANELRAAYRAHRAKKESRGRESNSRYLKSGKKKPLKQRISEGFFPEIQ